MERGRSRNGITGGLILVGVGVLALTGWWWPGIMVVLGIAIGEGSRSGDAMSRRCVSPPYSSASRFCRAAHPLADLRPDGLDRTRRVVLVKAFYSRQLVQPQYHWNHCMSGQSSGQGRHGSPQT